MPLTPERERELAELCRRFRIEALTAIHGAQSGHPGGSLSCCEIVTLLYQERMTVSAARPDAPPRPAPFPPSQIPENTLKQRHLHCEKCRESGLSAIECIKIPYRIHKTSGNIAGNMDNPTENKDKHA